MVDRDELVRRAAKLVPALRERAGLAEKLRQIPQEDRSTRQGQWGTAIGVGLKDKNLGLLGLGHIGSLVARVGNAFDMNVIAWSQNLTAQRAAECEATLVDKDTRRRPDRTPP